MPTYRDLPRAKGWPLLGDVPAFSRDPLGFLTRLHRQHGGLVALRFGPIPGVAINDPELIQDLLVKRHRILQKSWDTRWLEGVTGKGLLTSEGALWERHRRVIQTAFRNEELRGYAHTMDRCALQQLERWSDGAQLDLHAEMNELALRVVAQSLFGVDVGDLARDVAAPLDTIIRRFEELITSYLPMPPGVPSPGNRRLNAAVAQLDGVLNAIIARRRTQPKGHDLLSRLLSAEPSERFDDQELRDELITLLIAGHETTAIALTWALMLIADHPEVERRLLSESLDGVDLARAGKALPYHYNVVQEALRLYPPAWGIGRELLVDATVGGYDLRKGTQIYFTQWVTHRDRQFFEHPERFDPDRWLSPKHPRYAYFPFGAGPRVCVGLSFAMLEAVILLARIVEGFHIELRPDQAIELMPAVTLRPRHGLHATVRLRAREHQASSRRPAAE